LLLGENRGGFGTVRIHLARESSTVRTTRSAARVSPRLLEALGRLDNPALPIAEVHRRLGKEAERLGIARPSYERVRVLVHELRRLRRGPSTASVLIDVALRARPPQAFLEHVSGVGVPLHPTRARPRRPK
jgi:hypothetical protein